MSRVKKTAVVLTLGYGISQLLRLASNLVLTRILEPEVFGLMSFAFAVIVLITMFCDLGVDASLIREKGSDCSNYRKTAFTLKVATGFILALFLLIGAGLVYLGQLNDFFSKDTALNHSELPYILAALSLQPIIIGFRSLDCIYLVKRLQQGKVVTLEVCSQLFGTIVSILLAYYYQSVWALVIGVLASALIHTIVSYSLVANSKENIGFDKPSFHKIFKFGLWILLSSLITGLVAQVDKFVFASYVDATLLGVFSIAILIHLAAYQMVSMINHKVFFPKFSEENAKGFEHLYRYYYATRKFSDFFAYLVFSLLFFLSQYIVDILFDSRYAEAGTILRILSFQFLFISTVVSRTVYMCIGRPKWATFMTFCEAISKTFLIMWLYHIGGFDLAVYGCSTYAFVSVFLCCYYNKKINMFSLMSELRLIVLLPCTILIGWFIQYCFSLFIGY